MPVRNTIDIHNMKTRDHKNASYWWCSYQSCNLVRILNPHQIQIDSYWLKLIRLQLFWFVSLFLFVVVVVFVCLFVCFLTKCVIFGALKEGSSHVTHTEGVFVGRKTHI